MLEWYRLRWRIEDWFRLLKTGCWVEALQRAVTLRAGGYQAAPRPPPVSRSNFRDPARGWVPGWAIGRTHPLGT